MFPERVKGLRIQSQMPQQRLAVAFNINAATYCKIGESERKAKKGHASILSKPLLPANTGHTLALWLAGQVPVVVPDGQKIASKALPWVPGTLKQDV